MFLFHRVSPDKTGQPLLGIVLKRGIFQRERVKMSQSWRICFINYFAFLFSISDLISECFGWKLKRNGPVFKEKQLLSDFLCKDYFVFLYNQSSHYSYPWQHLFWVFKKHVIFYLLTDLLTFLFCDSLTCLRTEASFSKVQRG